MKKILLNSQREKQAKVFFSNRLEILFAHLKKRLFADQDPFGRRLLILPSRPMETWLKLHVASDSDLGVFANVEHAFLERAVSRLSELNFELLAASLEAVKSDAQASIQKNTFSPPFCECFFSIYTALSSMVQEGEIELVRYLKGKHPKRQLYLAIELASLFKRYLIYGTAEIALWPSKPMDWQQRLFFRLFPNGVPTLDVANCEFQSIHLFAFSHLPSLYFDFFQKVGKEVPVYFYHLSASGHFWSDTLSVHESRHFLRQLKKKQAPQVQVEQLESYLQEGHPLLMSLGKVGRFFAKMVEESEVETVEDYFPLEGPLSALQVVQSHLLTLEVPEEVPESDDGSIQIVTAPTRHREIEVLLAKLQAMLSDDAQLEPKDIVVLAPDIGLYKPYIEACFEQQLPYQITDVSVCSENAFIKGLFDLFSLSKSRFSSVSMIALFEHPLFQARHNLLPDDIDQLHLWIKTYHIRWGIDLDQRNACLKQSHCKGEMDNEEGTWQSGIDALMHAFATEDSEEFSKSILLNKVIALIEMIYSDCTILEVEEMSPKKWAAFLKTLAVRYFLEDHALMQPFFDALAAIESVSAQPECGFSVIFTLLERQLSQECVTVNKNLLQSVHFCSLLPMRAIYSKVVYLLGMNLEQFPRQEQHSSLDLLKNQRTTYCPTRPEFDRYLFLEALLSVREKLILSYVDAPFENAGRSVVVQEFLFYLKHDLSFVWIDKIIQKHPALPFDPIYFSKEQKELQNPSQNDFKSACALLKQEHPFAFLGKLSRRSFALPKGEFYLDLKDLRRAFSSPLKNYFNQALNLSFWKPSVLEDEETMTSSPLEINRLKRLALYLNKTQDHFFSGPFREVEVKRFEKDISSINIFLEQQGVERQMIQPLAIPPMRVDLSDETTVILSGVIEGVSPLGLITLEKEDFKGAARHFPDFLIFNLISKEKKKKLLFTKSQTVKEPFFQDPLPLLKAFLEMTLISFEYPLVLQPGWLFSILENDPQSLEKAMDKPTYDEALLYAYRIASKPSAKNVIAAFGPLIEKTYGGLKNGWF